MDSTLGHEASPSGSGEAHGRDSLRLVKLRLALTLVAVAILPIAAVAPLARAVLDDTRSALDARLASDADHAAAEIRRELTGVRDALIAAATSDAAVAAVEGPADAPSVATVAKQLGELLQRPSASVEGAAILSVAGDLRAGVGDPSSSLVTVTPLRADRASFTVVRDGAAGDAAALMVSVPIGGAAPGKPSGRAVALVSLGALTAWAIAGSDAGRTIELLGTGGEQLATLGNTPGPNLPGAVLELATDTAQTSTADAAIAISGLEGWQVVASAPLPVTSLPFPALAALVGLLLVLVGVIWWMGRQIIRPAAELEAQRANLHDLYETARAAALRDNLTGLGNHRAFQEAVARMVDQARRYNTPFSLVLFDIDEFKRINDTRGHATGDELLCEVGDLIRSTVRIADAGYRIGGDEFALLLPSTDVAGAEVLTRRLLSRSLEDRSGGRYKGPISFSAGITACPAFGNTRLELTAQADAALYRGKRGGRTVVTVFDPAQDRGHVDEGMRSELSAAISVVIEANAMTPVYQPIVHLPTGRILGYEGLVRVSPERGFPHTGALFDAAEIAGRVLDLDRAALDVVLRGARGVADDTLLSLNVSPRSFEAPEFNATVFLAILRRHGVMPDRVILELTERDAIRDPDRLRATILQLQEAGIRVAADDVGAGNAGLRLLSQFRFDVVKIDLSLVQGGAAKDQTLSVLTSLVGLARRWGALTIAEGVETPAQLQMIRQLDIDAGQGYLLGRPGVVVDLPALDLATLAGEVGGGPPGDPSVAPSPTRPGANGASFEVAARLAPRPAPVVHTAASIIASGAPSPFAPR